MKKEPRVPLYRLGDLVNFRFSNGRKEFSCRGTICTVDMFRNGEQITEVEYDIERYKIAVKNIAESGLMDRITIYLGDAASFDFAEKYDLIFIDGPKAQNMKFFIKFQKNLAENGAIITDNLSFHGMVENRSLTHNYSTIKMVRKIARYVAFLKENPNANSDDVSEYEDKLIFGY